MWTVSFCFVSFIRYMLIWNNVILLWDNDVEMLYLYRYTYQLPPGRPNHTCGGANVWADIRSSGEVFCSAGSYCPSTTRKVACDSGYSFLYPFKLSSIIWNLILKSCVSTMLFFSHVLSANPFKLTMLLMLIQELLSNGVYIWET